MQMKRLLTLAMTCCYSNEHSIAYAQPPSPDAEAYILVDAQTGDVLCERIPKVIYLPARPRWDKAILAIDSAT